MGLNIKNEETCRLAGKAKTGAITLALRERMARETKRRSADARLRRMRAAANRCAALLGTGLSSAAHGELLYDEHGLPK